MMSQMHPYISYLSILSCAVSLKQGLQVETLSYNRARTVGLTLQIKATCTPCFHFNTRLGWDPYQQYSGGSQSCEHKFCMVPQVHQLGQPRCHADPWAALTIGWDATWSLCSLWGLLVSPMGKKIASPQYRHFQSQWSKASRLLDITSALIAFHQHHLLAGIPSLCPPVN